MRSAFSLLPLFLLLLWVGAVQASGRETRCAFDLGAGETKMRLMSAEGKRLLSEKVAIPFRRHLKEGKLPPELLEKARHEISRLRKRCEEAGATAFAGVAASAFRQAENGPAALEWLAKETGVPLTLVSAEEEAQLALVATAASLRLPPTAIVAWDLGGGSTQFCTLDECECLISTTENIGTESFREAVSRRLGRSSVSPVTAEEFSLMVAEARTLARALPRTIPEALGHEGTVLAGVSSAHTDSVFPLLRRHELGSYEASELRAAARPLLSLNLEQLQGAFPSNHSPGNVITNAALVVGYLEEFRVPLIPVDVNLCDGLLAPSSARYWR